MNVIEHYQVVTYLQKRDLLEQYRKAKLMLQQNLFSVVSLKKRKPKSSGIGIFV